MYILRDAIFCRETKHLMGKVFNNPKFPNGSLIRTSPIMNYDKENSILTTIKGSEYMIECFADIETEKKLIDKFSQES